MTGSSWASAFTDLQDGIDLAVSGIEVWVAEGTYVPGAVESDAFLTKSGVRVYGGFAGGETVRQLRDWNAHPTILSGEIGGPDATDNSWHVVVAGGSNSTAMVNGVTITRGYADDVFNPWGGGVNAGGGGVTLVNVTLIDNLALYGGGGAWAGVGGVIRAYNCSFIDNQAPNHPGGGLRVDVGAALERLILVNCLFAGNTAWSGGGLRLEGANPEPPVFVNVTVSGNTAHTGPGGGVDLFGTGAITFTNCIFWGNSAWIDPQIAGDIQSLTLNHSIFEGGLDRNRNRQPGHRSILRQPGHRLPAQPRFSRHRRRRQYRDPPRPRRPRRGSHHR